MRWTQEPIMSFWWNSLKETPDPDSVCDSVRSDIEKKKKNLIRSLVWLPYKDYLATQV